MQQHNDGAKAMDGLIDGQQQGGEKNALLKNGMSAWARR